MHVVCIMLGDNNLHSHQVREALQRKKNTDPLWDVIPALAEKPGDNVAVSGATGTCQVIPVGCSFKDRGMRPDQHDAVAVVHTLPQSFSAW